MKLTDFDFYLPPELIAQYPEAERDQSKLILPQLANKIISFAEIVDYLHKGDVMIFNDSKVINAKLSLKKSGREININLNKQVDANGTKWLAFARPAKKLAIGDEFYFDQHKITVSNKFAMGEVELDFTLKAIDIFAFLDKYGALPLPMYIKRKQAHKEDLARYQTVYAAEQGSVAAPTAGLHFSKELMQKLAAKNIEIHYVTLHVGAGTFLPVKTEDISQHKMHKEYCSIKPEVAKAVNKAKQETRRIIAVGTTAMRTLEAFAQNNQLQSGCKETDIFITPGYRFQVVDSLITNFHLPKSTLFMLVCAFAGIEKMHQLYQYAIEKKLRFFSYGDAMLLERQDL